VVQLDAYGSRSVRELSGGQQQRVALARAMVIEPDILLMDEPLGALDRQLRKDVQLEIRRMHVAQPRTTLYVTHDQEEALVMSDRVVVMADGVIQQIGTPADLYSRPANRFVADFIGEANILEGTLRSVGEAFQIAIPDGTVFAAAGAAVATGERVAVVVRPESVVLGPAAAACRNAFEGRVEQAIYVGDALRYVVQLPSGQSISAKLPHRAGGDAIAVGDRIRLGWDVESAWVVSCEPALTGAARP